MIDNAWSWAERNGRIRKNEVHGEEEAKLILDETFNYKDKTGQETNQEVNMAVEESWMHISNCIYNILTTGFCNLDHILLAYNQG